MHNIVTNRHKQPTKGDKMAIAKVAEKSGMVYAYSVGGSMLWARNGRLVAFTGATVVVEYCGQICTYDEHGTRID